MGYEHELAVAARAARAAAEVCERVRAHLEAKDILRKPDGSPVTVADFAAQSLIIHALHRAFPGDAIVAEEDARALRDSRHAVQRDAVISLVQSHTPDLGSDEVLATIDGGCAPGGTGRFWVIDPIDGTKGFLRQAQYAVAIALLDGGNVVVGVLACPNLPASASDPTSPPGCLFSAELARPASQASLSAGGERPLCVSDVDDPRRATVCVPVEAASASPIATASVLARLGTATPPLRIDSQAKYALIARGQATAYLRMSGHKPQNIWDHAAGIALVRAAGGVVTDTVGAPLELTAGRTLAHNVGVLATNGVLHGVLLRAIADTQ